MSAPPFFRIAIAAGVLCLSASLGHAFVQRKLASGAPCHWPDPATIQYVIDRVGSRDIPAGGGRDQVRLAFAWWSLDPHSSLRMTAAPGPPQDAAIEQDGINAVTWVEDPDFEGLAPDVLGSTRLYVDAQSGAIYEADIWLNGVSYTWSPLWSDAPHAPSGPAHVQAVATHLIGLFLGLDHSVDRGATMFPVLPVGPAAGIRIAPDEETAVREVYPAGSGVADTVIAGHVFKPAGPIEGAYVTARDLADGATYGAITGADGAYALHLPRAGSYRVRAQPYTTDARITLSPYYRALPPSSMDFPAAEYPGAIPLSAGQSVGTIDFPVASSGSIDDPFEPDGALALARPIPTDGTPRLHHSWSAGTPPAYDEDWSWFVSQPGHLYVIDTDVTGHSVAGFGTQAPAFARTSLRLHAGATPLAANDSRDPLSADFRSRIAFFETQAARTLTIRASMRDADTIGAGAYYNLAVTDVPPPLPAPHLDAVIPPEGSSAGGYAIVLQGTGFLPGVQVRFGSTPGVVANADGCDSGFSCSTLAVVVPPHAPLAVDVVVVNPGGAAVTLASGFTFLSALPGGYENGWESAFPATTPHFLGYGEAVCFGDYDRDGWVDLFRGANPPAGYPGNLLLHNERGTFEDVTSTVLDVVPAAITSCAWGDYDSDGWLDLIVTHSSAGSGLYHNDRNGALSTVSFPSLGGFDAAWFDYNHDGCLDLFVAQAFPDGNNELWRGHCDGSFVDVASGMGLAVDRHTTRVLIRDFNSDGWDDLYLANWSGTADILYSNQAGASFVDATAASGIQETRQCADVKSADLNGDGAADIVCSGDTRGANDSFKPPLWINDGAGHFTNRAQDAGLWAVPRFCNAITLFDRDNDGTEDIYLGCERAPFPPHAGEDLDVLFVNDGAASPVLTDRTIAAGISESAHPRTAWATAAADVDGDGDHDLYATGSSQHVTGIVPDDSDYFWRGTTTRPWERSPAHDWIKIRLHGAMRPSGTSHLSPVWGEGAKVTVVYDLGQSGGAPPSEGACLRRPLPAHARALTKQMTGGSHGQNAMELLFGLGPPRASESRYVDCVIVDWPSGLRRAYTRLAVNSYVELGEETATADLLSVVPSSGPVAGATTLRLVGFRFAAGARVRIGNFDAEDVEVVSENLITCTAPPHPPGLTDVVVVNPDGASGELADGYAYVAPVGSIEVVDPNPLMLAGPAVTSSLAVLAATAAPRVFGWAADGITPVVVRIPVPAAGLVDFAIYDEARRTTNVGTLRAPSSPTGGSTVTVSTNSVGGQHVGIAILTAPRSFRRDAGDDQAASRPITIEATFRPSTGGSTHVASTFSIVRPPVLLLHGLWSDRDTWDWELMADRRFVVHAHDYSATSDRSFRVNRWVPALGARETLTGFRARGLAGTKVAVFGHSLGGILGRLHASGLRTDYARADNFNAGDFYSLVTLNAAHEGTPLADFAMTVRDASTLGPQLEIGMDLIGMNIRNGAAWDLQTGSFETTHLPASTLPAHAFVAVGGSDLITRGIGHAAAAPQLKLALVTLQAFGFDLQAGFPQGSQHDFVVSKTSQEGGIDRTTLFHYVDEDNKAVHSDSMTRESNPNDRAVELMNTPVDDAAVWAPGFPAADTAPGATSFAPLRQRARTTMSPASTGSIAITTPAPGSFFRQGDSVVVAAEPGGGFVPSRMAFFAGDSDAVLLRAAPWTATLRIGASVVGTTTLRVVAIGANDATASAEVSIRVASSGAELLGLSVTPHDVIFFEAKQRAQLVVVGRYTDGIDRTITSQATGTIYDSLDSTIVTVSSEGVATGHSVGATQLIVRNGVTQAAVDVRVDSLPLKLTFETKITLSWPRKPGAVGYDLVTGSLNQLRANAGSFATAITGCVARNAPEPTAAAATNPASGQGFFYLLRYRRPGSPASYDEFPDWMENQVGKRDASIALAAGACAP